MSARRPANPRSLGGFLSTTVVSIGLVLGVSLIGSTPVSAQESGNAKVELSLHQLTVQAAPSPEFVSMNVRIASPSGALVVNARSVRDAVAWTPGADDQDGLYRYEVVTVVKDEQGKEQLLRSRGTFTVRQGRIAIEAMKQGRNEYEATSLVRHAGRFLLVVASRVLEAIVPPAAAQDLTASSTVPTVDFQDTNPFAGGAPRLVWDITGSEASVAPCANATTDVLFRMRDAASNQIIAICSRGTAAESTMIVDPLGDISFANGAVFIDRSLGRLGIGTNAPGAELQLNGISPEIRLLDETDNETVDLLYDANEFVIENGTSGANIVGIHEAAPASSLRILSSGNTGVGTGAPAARLHVVGTTPPQFIVENTAGNARMDFRRSSATGVSQLLFGTGPLAGGTLDYQIGMFLDTVFQIRVTNDSTRGIVLTPGGNVGIGTTAPGAKLEVAGIVAATGYATTSDGRLKENVAPIAGALAKVMALEGVSFTWKKDGNGKRGFPDGAHYGVIAQQVEAIVPAVVREGRDGERAVAYAELVPVLIEAIKEQQAIIRDLRDEIAEIRMEARSGGAARLTSASR